MARTVPQTMLEKFSTFGDFLRFLRRRAGLTQIELAAAVGYSDTQISRLEHNQRPPDIPTLEARFLNALGVENDEKIVNRLLDLAANVRREDAPALGMCPYKGLNYYEEADADLFVGREKLTAKLYNQVATFTSKEFAKQLRFLAVVGASGSGKSSLVRAGLVPSLRWEGESKNWLIHVFTPTAHPLDSLASILVQETVSVKETAALMDDFSSDTRSLQIFAKKLLRKENNSHLLLVIDQFEELFTMCHSEKERLAFISNLFTAASEKNGSVSIVITLRADFYENCSRYIQLRDALAKNQEYIGAMDEDELRRTIEEPAHRRKWDFEDGLVDLLLHDIGQEPGALPLLSHALLETWERRRGRTLTFSGYASSGGVHGAITETAESVFKDRLTHDQQLIARRIFLRLTEVGEDSSTVYTRRRVGLDELTSSSGENDPTLNVLNILAEARLISLGQNSAEVAHEALIREWPALQTWLEENRTRLKLQRQLTDAAQNWKETNYSKEMLFPGKRLEQFGGWQDQEELALSQLETEFLQASQAFNQKQEKKQAQQKQTQQNLRRALIGSLSLGFILAAVLSLFAFNARNDAERSAAEFRSIALASGAQEELDTGFPDVALALAIEANKMENPPPRSEQMLFTAATSTWMRSRLNHSAAVRGVEFSPDGSILLTTGDSHSAFLWDVSSEEIINSLDYDEILTEAAFQPDGPLIAIGTWDGKILLWDPAGETVDTISVGESVINEVIFTLDGKQILASNEDAQITLWDIATKRLANRFSGHTGAVYSLDFNSDGSRFISGSNDNTARLWDLESGESLNIFEMPSGDGLSQERGVWGISFLPNDQQMITGDLGGFIYLWDVETAEILREYPDVRSPVLSITISPDGESVLASTASGEAYMNLYDIQSGKVLRSYYGHTIGIWETAFSPDGNTVASASIDGSAAIWDVAVPGLLYRVKLPPSGGGSALAINPDGKTFFEGGIDGVIRMREIATGRVIRSFDENMGRWPLSLGVSPDSNYLISGDYVTSDPQDQQNAYLWDLSSGEIIHTFDQHIGHISGITYSPDGTTVAISEFSGKRILVYTIPSGELLQILEGHTNWVQNVAFGNDGLKLYSAGRDLTVREWDIETGENTRTFEGHASRIRGIDVSPDGKYLVSGSDDLTLKIWNLDTGIAEKTLIGHDSFIYNAYFSPDGKYILSTGFNLNAILWDVETGSPLWKFHGHSPNALDLVLGNFSPDGKIIITISEDSEIIAWDVSQLPDNFESWVLENRFVPELSCEQRELYQVEPLCDSAHQNE